MCTGNICRSPTAHGVCRHHAEQRGLAPHIEIDSCGTDSYHVGERPDPRARRLAKSKGIDIDDLRARQVTDRDLDECDFVLAMDDINLQILRGLCTAGRESRISLLTDYAPHLGVSTVPDPYYGDGDGFERVFTIIEESVIGLLDEIEHQLGARRKKRSR